MTWRAWRGAALWAAVILVGTSIPGRELPRAPLGTDKLVHVALYATLGWLTARALRADGLVRGSAVALALAALAAFGGVDELHQSLIPGRGADPFDWLADVIGAAVGLLYPLSPTLRPEHRT